MKKIFAVMLMLLVLTATVPVQANDSFTTELIAGQNVVVGEVKVWQDPVNLYVEYLINADLTPEDLSDDGVPTLIYETHLHIAGTAGDIPQTKKGDPIPGKFDYPMMFEEGVSEYEYEIPLADLPEGPWDIAAHAVVKKLGGLEGLELALPDQVTFKPINYLGTAYFDSYVYGVTILDGTYSSWCIDYTHGISIDNEYDAKVYSSYEQLPEYLLTGTDPHIDNPENLDLVNWIINQDWQSQGYTFLNVQNAIWYLIDDNPPTCGPACEEIADAADEYGQDYVPGCDDVFAVILAPIDATAQVVIAQVTLSEVKVPCVTVDETAWADGEKFVSKGNWAMYFTYPPK